MKSDLSHWFREGATALGQVTTNWETIQKARANDDEGRTALRLLAERYYGPVFRTLRLSGLPRDAAMEMTQRFMLRFCEGKFVDAAQPSRGRFRAFLKTSLRNFVQDEREKEQRRLGVPLEGLDPGAGPGSEETLDREMARHALEKAQQETRLRLADQQQAWEALWRFDLRPASGRERSQDAVAAELGLEVAAFRRALYHAREVFKEEVCRILREGVSSDEELDAEIDWFLRAVTGVA